jgi:hypothetical protein
MPERAENSCQDLQPELVNFIKDAEYAFAPAATNRGIAYIVKVPPQDVDSMRSVRMANLRYKLYDCPSAPAVQTVACFSDQPHAPLKLELFTDVSQPRERRELVMLSTQEYINFLFYDQELKRRFIKRIQMSDGNRETLVSILDRADGLLAAISPEEFNFKKAREEVIAETEF